MYYAQARSFNNGIDFYDGKTNTTISVRRDIDGKIIVKKYDKITVPGKLRKDSLMTQFVILLLSFVTSYIVSRINSLKLEIIVIILLFWISTFLCFFINSKNPKYFSTFRYHAAEHKALSYFEQYGEATMDFDKIKEMPSIDINCGSTVIAVVYIFITLSIIGVLFIPYIFLKITWCIISIIPTLYLWVNEKCNFFQRFVIQEPSQTEIEVAAIGLAEYLKVHK